MRSDSAELKKEFSVRAGESEIEIFAIDSQALVRRLVRQPGKAGRLRHHNPQHSGSFLAGLGIVGYGRKEFIRPREVVGRGIGAGEVYCCENLANGVH